MDDGTREKLTVPEPQIERAFFRMCGDGRLLIYDADTCNIGPIFVFHR